MKEYESSIDTQELNKFAQISSQWWDKNGPLKTLHDINEPRLNFIKQHHNLAGAQVLDLGCGGGILAEAMSREGAHVTAIDAESQSIGVAMQHAKTNGIDIEYHCTPVEDFDHKPFDVITCMEMLEHVPNPLLVLEHCKRLLKPDGYLFVSTINRTLKAYASAIIAAEYILQLLPKQTHDFKKFIKPSEMSAMARSLDLDLVDLQGMSYNPFTRQAKLDSDVSVNYLMVFAPA